MFIRIETVPSLLTFAGRIGGVGTITVPAAPPVPSLKSSALFSAVLGLVANAPSFQMRQPVEMLVAVGVLQSTALVHPAMPGSHIQGKYGCTPLGVTGPA